MRFAKAPVAAEDLTVSVASHGLAGSQRDLPASPLDRAGWRLLLAETRNERITGPLMAAIEDGTLPATPEQAAQARDAHLRAVTVCLALERLLLDAAGWLREAGVTYRVLKGPALAQLVYREPTLRTFGDIDLIVPAGDFSDAVGVFLAAGGHRRYPEPRPGFDRRFSKGTSFTMPGGLEIDLHRTLVLGPFGLTVQLDDLFATASPFTLAGEELPALGPEERFVHACFHAVLGGIVGARLVPLRDVAECLLAEPLDHDHVLHLARRWQAEVVVAAAVAAAWDAFQLVDRVPTSVWAERYAPTARERRWLDLYLGEGRNTVGQSVAAVRAIPGARDKLAYLQAILLPRETPAGGRGRRARRGARALRARRRSGR